MPITVMCDESLFFSDPANTRAVTEYGSDASVGAYHAPRCPHYKGRCTVDAEAVQLSPECVAAIPYGDAAAQGLDYDQRSGCTFRKPIFLHTTHHGLVVSLGEYNGYHDSDFYAVVWNPEKQRTEHVQYATTRGWTYPNSARVDATPEVLAEVDAYHERVRAAYAAKVRAEQDAEDAKRAEQRAYLDAAARLKGRDYTIGRGKKAVTGKVFWLGASKGGYGVRMGVKLPDGAVKWVAAPSPDWIAANT